MSDTRSTPEAAPAEPHAVCIADLLRDRRFQVRQRLDPGTVDRYAHVIAGGVEMPPVKVAVVAGVPVVVDGWHRIAAHERCGIPTVSAVFVEATDNEARWLAAQANFAHGLPLKGRELRVAFRAFIGARKHLKPALRRGEAHSLLSYREIARELGGLVRHTTVRNWMQSDFPKIARRMGGEAGFQANEPPGPADPQAGFQQTVEDALRSAAAAARGVSDPERRGAIIVAAEEFLRGLREGGAWVPPGPLEF